MKTTGTTRTTRTARPTRSTRSGGKFRRATTATTLALLLALPTAVLTPAAGRAASGESISMNLASTTGTANAVGEGFLYGLSQDGSAPGDNYVQSLNPNLMRGGGARISGDGWIGDGYTAGAGFTARINSALA